MDMLLSGLLGALIATLLSVLYQHLFFLANERKKLFLEMVSWLDNIENLLQGLHVQKEVVYEGKDKHLSDDEYRSTSRQLKKMLLSGKIEAMTCLAYGLRSESQKIKTLKEKFLGIARILWGSRVDNWDENSRIIFRIFNDEIEPLKGKTLKALHDGTKWDNILFFIMRENFPTVSNCFSRLKRLGRKNKRS